MLDGFPSSLSDFDFRLIHWERKLPTKVSFSLVRVLRYCPGIVISYSSPGYNVCISKHNKIFNCNWGRSFYQPTRLIQYIDILQVPPSSLHFNVVWNISISILMPLGINRRDRNRTYIDGWVFTIVTVEAFLQLHVLTHRLLTAACHSPPPLYLPLLSTRIRGNGDSSDGHLTYCLYRWAQPLSFSGNILSVFEVYTLHQIRITWRIPDSNWGLFHLVSRKW